MKEDQSEPRRTILKALGAGGLAAAGLTASAGSATAQPGKPGGLTLVDDLSDVDLTDQSGDVVDTFDEGTLTVDSLSIDQRTGDLLADGTIEGTLSDAGEQITESFQNVTAENFSTNDACTILTLDLGPLDLELLGLNVFLDEVNLEITGETGAGNLLGNLLCGIADLGSGGLSNLANSIVSALNNLLNALLG